MVFMPDFNDALLCRARSRSATRFLLGTTCEVFLTIDGDIRFDTNDALKICEHARDPNTPIVFGLYMKRQPGGAGPASILKADVEYTFEAGQPLKEIEYGSTGFMAVNRCVFQKLSEGMTLLHKSAEVIRMFPFFQPMAHQPSWINEEIYLSEDWSFCERARQAGFPILLDQTVRLMHYGEYPYMHEDILAKVHKPTPMRITRQSNGTHRVETPDEEPMAIGP